MTRVLDTSWSVCLLHLVAHAVFKSMLFMVVGLLLHAVGQQDSRTLPSLVPWSDSGAESYLSWLRD